jgi:hypothetical protein
VSKLLKIIAAGFFLFKILAILKTHLGERVLEEAGWVDFGLQWVPL